MKVILLTFLFLILFLGSANAQTMSNSQYKIIEGNLNSGSGIVTNSQYTLNETLGQTAANLFTGPNYQVFAGFQDSKAGPIPFSFSISNSVIDFGIITPTNPLIRTTELTVNAPSTKGFTVTASEDKPLTSSSSAIPNTSCDNGDCNDTKASVWLSSLAYGFGYRCDDLQGINCPLDFVPNSYKAFSTSLQTVMTSSIGGRGMKSRITYKVNVSGTQSPGVYTNTVTYIANPGF